MIKQAKLCTLCLLAGILIMSACQKGADVLDPPTKAELLADGSWLYKAHTIEPGTISGGDVITDLYIQKNECEKDDVLTFTSTNTFIWDEGDELCDTDQVIDTGTWVFRANQDNIFMDYDTNDSLDVELVFSNLNRDELVLLKKYTIGTTNYEETITYESID